MIEKEETVHLPSAKVEIEDQETSVLQSHPPVQKEKHTSGIVDEKTTPLSAIAAIDTRVLPTYHRRKILSRPRLVILIACLSGFIITLIVGGTVFALNSVPGKPEPVPNTPVAQNPTVQPTPSPTPTSAPTPTPSAQPVSPFPSTLLSEINTLVAHDRFFYHGNTNLPEIALTFDDGPNPSYTPQILAILKKYQVKATFFDVGRLVQAYPDLVRQEFSDGHTIGNHSWTHANLALLTPAAIQAQFKQTADAIERVTGVRPMFMRPPYGSLSSSVLTVANNSALSTVIWNDEAKDWALPGVSVIVNRILNLAGKGAIILLHDGGGNRLQTIMALPTIIEQLRARGYTFVTMEEMAAHMHIQTNNGTPTSAPTPGGNFVPSLEGEIRAVFN